MPEKKNGWSPDPARSLEVGFVVVIALRDGTCPRTGRIEALDQIGVRITGVDWLMGAFSGWDYFIPWSSVEHMEVFTPQHQTLEDFMDSAVKFCKRHTRVGKPQDQESKVQEGHPL